MRAKIDERERARHLRTQGRTYDEIQAELGVSKSSISLWVRDLPRPPRRAPRCTGIERMRPVMVRRAKERAAVVSAAQADVGVLSARELFLVGVAFYWAEGSKPRPHARVIFTNSDPNVIRLFEAWLDLLAVSRDRRRYSVSIHETADIPAAERFWADVVGTGAESFNKPLVKRHNPRTNRKNVGDRYHGCLRVAVLGSADLYRRIEGWWLGMVVDVGPRTP